MVDQNVQQAMVSLKSLHAAAFSLTFQDRYDHYHPPLSDLEFMSNVFDEIHHEIKYLTVAAGFPCDPTYFQGLLYTWR